FLVQRFKRLTIHPELESAAAPLVKIVSRGNARRTPESGGEQLQFEVTNSELREEYLAAVLEIHKSPRLFGMMHLTNNEAPANDRGCVADASHVS
ncbi:MAG: hypothetical protein WBG11_14520, partial [Methylocella sp.]